MSSVESAAALLRTCYGQLFVVAGALQPGAGESLGGARAIQTFILSRLTEARNRLLGAGYAETTVDDAQLPVVALLDERALRVPGLRDSWEPLQFTLYGNTELGKLFFERLRSLRLDPATPVPLLELYDRCLLWEFQGEYGARGQLEELEAVRTQLHNEIVAKSRRRSPIPELADAPVARTGTRILAWWWVGILLLAVLVFRWVEHTVDLSREADRLAVEVKSRESQIAGRNVARAEDGRAGRWRESVAPEPRDGAPDRFPGR